MQNPNDDEVRALAALVGGSNFDVFFDWLDRSLQTRLRVNCHLTGDEALKGAGRALELEALMEHIKKAPTYLASLRITKQQEKEG